MYRRCAWGSRQRPAGRARVAGTGPQTADLRRPRCPDPPRSKIPRRPGHRARGYRRRSYSVAAGNGRRVCHPPCVIDVRAAQPITHSRRLFAIGRSHGREGNPGTERGGASGSRGSAAARGCGNRRCDGARCTRRSVHARSRPGRGLASQPDAGASAARLRLGVLGYDWPAEAHPRRAPSSAALRERSGRVAGVFAARCGLSSHAHASWQRLAQRMVESASKRSIDRLPS